MTKIEKVKFMLELDQVLSAETMKQIKEIGYSRIPIRENGSSNQIVAFLLTKSLIGLDTSMGKTLRQLYQDKAIQIKIPLYLHKECTLGRMIKSFQTGRSHMAIVCQTLEGAHELHERADKHYANLNRKQQHSDEISFNDSIYLTSEVMGIVTLENVIERILLQEIHDEKDREEAIGLL